MVTNYTHNDYYIRDVISKNNEQKNDNVLGSKIDRATHCILVALVSVRWGDEKRKQTTETTYNKSFRASEHEKQKQKLLRYNRRFFMYLLHVQFSDIQNSWHSLEMRETMVILVSKRIEVKSKKTT